MTKENEFSVDERKWGEMSTGTMAIAISALFYAGFASEAQTRGLDYGDAMLVVDESDMMSCIKEGGCSDVKS